MVECLWVINEHRYPWFMGIGMDTGELNYNGTDWHKVNCLIHYRMGLIDCGKTDFDSILSIYLAATTSLFIEKTL